jgi:hypothetical protein
MNSRIPRSLLTVPLSTLFLLLTTPGNGRALDQFVAYDRSYEVIEFERTVDTTNDELLKETLLEEEELFCRPLESTDEVPDPNEPAGLLFYEEFEEEPFDPARDADVIEPDLTATEERFELVYRDYTSLRTIESKIEDGE